MDMGRLDLGGGPQVAGAASHGEGPRPGGSGGGPGGAGVSGPASGPVSVNELTGPRTGSPAVEVVLTAREQSFRLVSGELVEGFTVNGTSPGPVLRARQGDLVQVTLQNADVRGGVTLHWHGVDVPNAEDGVAGVTQDAVPQGGRHVYRFVVQDAGTYWYHSHQVSARQVRGGLFGVLVVDPVRPSDGTADVVAPVHNYAGRRTISGRTGEQHVPLTSGTAARVRLVNTHDGSLRAWVSGAAFRVLAVDGHDVVEPTLVRDRVLVVPAGGRIDVQLTAPPDGTAVRLDVGGAALVLGPAGSSQPVSPQPTARVDLLSYGTPEPTGLPAHVDRRFRYDIGRRPGFVDGRPGFFWTINGALWPHVPMFAVAEGDSVRMTIRNTSGGVHPMHLHGHHAVVLSRNGVAATGSPWVVDSLEVEDGETYEIGFVADNPGVWMDHCHSLPHAAQGLVAHLMYAGVTTPYRVGADRAGKPTNSPE